MTADPRATARQWLAEIIARARNPWATRGEIIVMPDEYKACYAMADAILADVEVTTILRPIDDSRRVALLLPAEGP